MPRSVPSATPWTTRSWNPRSACTRPSRARPAGPGTGLADVELGTAEWVDRFNNKRLHTAIGDIPPHEHETNLYAQHQPQPAAGVGA
ncbi:integrase core domain-containing protein [Streptomyces sp. LaBMicrA B280]|uniref:integrase core domain-containing protein n=1 Tax=Streptomyces sp. LaBMicrA B280 TaxID=3391001 RepID=UPI003BA62425